jgi:GntR family transcriptional regulator, rspAB operon transcriptional repressor
MAVERTPDEGDRGLTSESQQIEERLRRKILALELAPGSCVTHSHLCSVLHCSRMPLREAIQRLSKEGLLVSLPKKGVAIAPLNLGDFSALREAQAVVEAYCVRVAAERMSAGELVRMEEILTRAEEASGSGDFEAMADLDLQFHRAIAVATRNAYMCETMVSLHRHAIRFGCIAWRRDGGSAASCAEHRRMVEAFRRHDGAEAERIMREHTQTANARILGSSAPQKPSESQVPPAFS